MKTITLPAGRGLPDQGAALQDQIRDVLPGSTQLPPAALAADMLLVPAPFAAVHAQRLVVLVPAGEIDEHALACRVWQLASCSGLSVLYLALSPETDQIATQRRRLISLASQTAHPQVRTEIGLPAARNWPHTLRQTLQPGDLLVCLAEDRSPGFFRRKPLAPHLVAALRVPVYLFGDLQVKPALSSQHSLKNVLAWMATLSLVATFFWLQVGIDRLSAKPQATILLCLSFLVELYLVFKINEWVG